MPENDPDSDAQANDPPPLSGGSAYGSMPSSLTGRPMSGNVPPAPGDGDGGGEEGSFAAASPYQVTPAVANPADTFEANLANQEEDVLVLASPVIRAAAVAIDGALMFIPFIIIGLIVDGPAYLEEGSDPSDFAMGLGGGYLLLFLIAQIVMLSTRGQSFGKMMVGIKIVVHHTGETAGFLNAVLLRRFVGGLPAIIPCLGWIYLIVDGCFIFQAGHRTLHDLIGGTSVIKAPKVVKTVEQRLRAG